MTLTLEVRNIHGQTLASTSGEQEIVLVYQPEYAPGDSLYLASSEPRVPLVVSLDDTMAPALVVLKGNSFAFPIPFEKAKIPYSPRSFSGELHRLHVRKAYPEEVAIRRNLAFNPYDHNANETLFPHASANVETRGEAVFAARNAIDGEIANSDHGFWPYSSWGINRDPEAALTLNFGRDTLVDGVTIYLRADFPHDAWWESATITLSTGQALPLPLEKTGAGQHFPLPPKQIEWLRLDRLIKADDPSPFPALTQIQVWGRDL
jgi:hypothetical protein